MQTVHLKIWSKYTTALVDVTGSGSSAMVWSPHWPVIFSVLLAIRTRLSLIADCTLKKTRPAGYMFRCKHSKSKGSDVFKETTTNYDARPRRLCAMVSFEDFVLPVHR